MEKLAPGIIGFVAAASSLERAAALVVANAMLLSGTSRWGREFAHAPMKLPLPALRDALGFLADHHAQLEAAFQSASGRASSDPYVSACRWELVATQTVMATAGARLERVYAVTARKAWQILWSARRSSFEAVNALQEYGKAYSTPPVPEIPGKKMDRALLMALATNLPPMFRKQGNSQ